MRGHYEPHLTKYEDTLEDIFLAKQNRMQGLQSVSTPTTHAHKQALIPILLSCYQQQWYISMAKEFMSFSLWSFTFFHLLAVGGSYVNFGQGDEAHQPG